MVSYQYELIDIFDILLLVIMKLLSDWFALVQGRALLLHHSVLSSPLSQHLLGVPAVAAFSLP